MSRGKIEPSEFGVNLSLEAFTDEMVNDFAYAYQVIWSFDELLLHPQEAAHFCAFVRQKHGYTNLPNDIILRVIMSRNKSP